MRFFSSSLSFCLGLAGILAFLSPIGSLLAFLADLEADTLLSLLGLSILLMAGGLSALVRVAVDEIRSVE